MAKEYGFIYDKAGNLKSVSAPVYANGRKVRKHRKTVTGAIPAGVGFSGFNNGSHSGVARKAAELS
jgi:hypothetical protein